MVIKTDEKKLTILFYSIKPVTIKLSTTVSWRPLFFKYSEFVTAFLYYTNGNQCDIQHKQLNIRNNSLNRTQKRLVFSARSFYEDMFVIS